MKKIGIVLLLVCICLFASCAPDKTFQEDIKQGQEDNNIIRLGFSYAEVISESSPWISTAIECEKEQDIVTELTIYVGHWLGFMENWNENVWLSNPGYGKFVVQRTIYDDNLNLYSQKYFDLYDFGNDEKYLMRYTNAPEASDKFVEVEYKYSFKDSIDFNEIDLEQGFVKYDICLVDDENHFITQEFYFGIFNAILRFTNNKMSIIFSKK